MVGRLRIDTSSCLALQLMLMTEVNCVAYVARAVDMAALKSHVLYQQERLVVRAVCSAEQRLWVRL